METAAITESLSLTITREDAIISILDLCERAILFAPTEAEFAAMSTSEVLMYEAQLREELERQYDAEEEYLTRRMADERIDEGFDPYTNSYTDDC